MRALRTAQRIPLDQQATACVAPTRKPPDRRPPAAGPPGAPPRPLAPAHSLTSWPAASVIAFALALCRAGRVQTNRTDQQLHHYATHPCIVPPRLDRLLTSSPPSLSLNIWHLEQQMSLAPRPMRPIVISTRAPCPVVPRLEARDSDDGSEDRSVPSRRVSRSVSSRLCAGTRRPRVLCLYVWSIATI